MAYAKACFEEVKAISPKVVESVDTHKWYSPKEVGNIPHEKRTPYTFHPPRTTPP
jgi:hypothetical protein